MNKKLLATILVGVMTLAFVNAGLLAYYGQVNANIEVTQPIRVAGNLEYTIENAVAGEIVEGEIITISNDADFPVDIILSNSYSIQSANYTWEGDGVNVIYKYSTCYNEEEGCSVYQILEGNTITIPKKAEGWGSGVLLRISYEIDNMLETGTYTITTTISDEGFNSLIIP